MFKYVFFDFDGTLIDTNEIIVKCLNFVSSKYNGRELNDRELTGILGKPLEIQMKEICESRYEELTLDYKSMYRSLRDEMTTEFSGITDMLKAIRCSGVKVAIISNKGTSGINHGIEKFSLSEYIDYVVSSEDVILKKPHPEGIYKAMAYLGLGEEDKKDIVFVGDSIHDIECGKNAGLKTVLVGWTIMDKEVLLKSEPDYVAKDSKDLEKIILS